MSSSRNIGNSHPASTLHYDQFGRFSQIRFTELAHLGAKRALRKVERSYDQLPGRTSMKPMRPERLPLHQTRSGLFGSISSRRGSDSESGSGNSTHSPVLGLKRAILSAVCSLTQIRLFLRSTV